MTGEERVAALAQLSELLLKYVHVSRDFERVPSNYGLREAFGLGTVLSHMEIHMLAEIWKNPGITAQELAERFNRTKGAVSQIVKTLCREGLAVKRENPQNARFNNLYVTEQGRVACENHERHERELFERMLPQFESFTQADFAAMQQMLRIFADAIVRQGEKGNDEQ